MDPSTLRITTSNSLGRKPEPTNRTRPKTQISRTAVLQKGRSQLWECRSAPLNLVRREMRPGDQPCSGHLGAQNRKKPAIEVLLLVLVLVVVVQGQHTDADIDADGVDALAR